LDEGVLVVERDRWPCVPHPLIVTPLLSASGGRLGTPHQYGCGVLGAAEPRVVRTRSSGGPCGQPLPWTGDTTPRRAAPRRPAGRPVTASGRRPPGTPLAALSAEPARTSAATLRPARRACARHRFSDRGRHPRHHPAPAPAARHLAPAGWSPRSGRDS